MKLKLPVLFSAIAALLLTGLLLAAKSPQDATRRTLRWLHRTTYKPTAALDRSHRDATEYWKRSNGEAGMKHLESKKAASHEGWFVA